MGILTDHLHDMLDEQDKELEKLHTVEGILKEPETDDAHWLLGQVYEALNIPIPSWVG